MSWRHVLLLLCGLLPKAPARCLPYGLGEAQRRNVSVGEQSAPLGIWQLDWESSKIASAIMTIIAREVLGYNVRVGTGRSSESAYHALAGCPDGEDCMESLPEAAPPAIWHLGFEVWASSARRVSAKYKKKLSSRCAQDLGSVGYEGMEGDYIHPDSVLSGSVHWLDLLDYTSYNASLRSPHNYFTMIETIDFDALVPCSEWVERTVESLRAGLDEYVQHFPLESGEGAQWNASGHHSPICPDPEGRWWLSPACRADWSRCIPYVAAWEGWGVAEMLQRATALNMPVAIGIPKSRQHWQNLTKTYRVMNYWWFPELSFVLEGLQAVHYEPHDATQWERGLRVTQRAPDLLQKLVFSGVQQGEPYAHVASNLSLSRDDMYSLLTEVQRGESPEQVACWWLGTHSADWHSWVPQAVLEPLRCEPGQGVADASGMELPSPQGATSCAWCKQGSASRQYEIDGPHKVCSACLEGYFQGMARKEQCEPCALGRFSAKRGATECELCPAGRFAEEEGATACLKCSSIQPGTTSEAGASSRDQCSLCSPGMFSNGLEAMCDPSNPAAILSSLAVLVLWCAAAALVAMALRRDLQISDVHEQGQTTILRTAGPHGLVPFKRELRVTIEDSRNLFLKGQYKVKWHSKQAFELLDEGGREMSDAKLEASSGVLTVGFPWGILITGAFDSRFLTVVNVASTLLVLSIVILLVVPFPAAYLVACGLGTLAVFVTILIGRQFRRRRFRASPAQLAVQEFKSVLQKHRPRTGQATKPGAQRAIRARQLSDFYEFFRSYIGDRSMYYVVNELVKPITEEEGLSYADVVGGSEVQWFVSHYWGDPFLDFVKSILNHARERMLLTEELKGTCSFVSDGPRRSISQSDLACLWWNTSFWICSFAINQWRAEEEVGQTPQESSFYSALTHPTCQGTLMVLQESASPLRRSWCLFEVYETYQLSKRSEESHFQGLFLGTSSGVLNTGSAPVDVVMKIAGAITQVFFETAEASREEDKRLIDAEVSKVGFKALNGFLREMMKAAVEEGKTKLDDKVKQILAELDECESAVVQGATTLRSLTFTKVFESHGSHVSQDDDDPWQNLPA